MDEISEITDYIQEQAGMSAEVIWGYGQDNSLGDEVCVTVIATGFTGTSASANWEEKSEEPKKMWLETEGAKEIIQKVDTPVFENPSVNEVAEIAEVVEEQPTEPFLKPVEPTFEFEFEVDNKIDHTETVQEEVPGLSALKMREDEHALDAPLAADLGVNLSEITAKSAEEAPAVTMIHREQPVMSDRPNRAELNERNREREMRIREFTIKLKTPNGLSELENEPAYARKKVSLESAPHSSDSNISRFSLNESVDDSGNRKVELRENPFLHDNVD